MHREPTWWVADETFYRPKYRSTIWQLLVLADLGLTRKDKRIANAVDFWFRLHYANDGGYSPGVRCQMQTISARRATWRGPSSGSDVCETKIITLLALHVRGRGEHA